jgi:hypothetical protein
VIYIIKTSILLLIITPLTAVLAGESPYDKFTAKKNFTNETTITWSQADDIEKACDIESKRVGNNGFSYKLEACSFWTKTQEGQHKCHIITSNKMDYWTLGHEMRHCFQGEYHK